MVVRQSKQIYDIVNTYMKSDVDLEAASSRVALVTRSKSACKWFLTSVCQLVRL